MRWWAPYHLFKKKKKKDNIKTQSAPSIQTEWDKVVSLLPDAESIFTSSARNLVFHSLVKRRREYFVYVGLKLPEEQPKMPLQPNISINLCSNKTDRYVQDVIT